MSPELGTIAFNVCFNYNMKIWPVSDMMKSWRLRNTQKAFVLDKNKSNNSLTPFWLFPFAFISIQWLHNRHRLIDKTHICRHKAMNKLFCLAHLTYINLVLRMTGCCILLLKCIEFQQNLSQGFKKRFKQPIRFALSLSWEICLFDLFILSYSFLYAM